MLLRQPIALIRNILDTFIHQAITNFADNQVSTKTIPMYIKYVANGNRLFDIDRFLLLLSNAVVYRLEMEI